MRGVVFTPRFLCAALYAIHGRTRVFDRVCILESLLR